ncbi:MAG: hypothetical protein FWC41_08945 [Firmicutes bacterium]|nr:hypothetical protein [Bacillota bacterium]
MKIIKIGEIGNQYGIVFEYNENYKTLRLIIKGHAYHLSNKDTLDFNKQLKIAISNNELKK